MGAGRPPKYKTAAELDKAIQEYFDKCGPAPMMYEIDGVQHIATDKNGRPIVLENPATMAGLSYHLGYNTRNAIYDIEHKGNEQFSDLIKRARLKIESEHESRLCTKDKPTGSIFWLKNHGWIDDKKQEQDTANSLEKLAAIISQALGK